MYNVTECPVCGHSEHTHFIEAVGQCNECEAGIHEDDCYHLDSPFPEHSDGPEHQSY